MKGGGDQAKEPSINGNNTTDDLQNAQSLSDHMKGGGDQAQGPVVTETYPRRARLASILP